MVMRVAEVARRSPTHTSVAATTTATTLYTADDTDSYITICNNSSQRLFILLGSVAEVGTVTTTTPITVCLASCQYYEIQYPFAGTIQGVWGGTNPTGYAEITTVHE